MSRSDFIFTLKRNQRAHACEPLIHALENGLMEEDEGE